MRGPTLKPTILIVDDHQTFRASLRHWLTGEFPQCSIGEAASVEEAVASVRTISPTIVIMDIGLPGINGIEATQGIKAILPAVKVVILTIHEDQIYQDRAMAAGVSAYIPKRKMRTDLLPTIAMLLAAQNSAKKEAVL